MEALDYLNKTLNFINSILKGEADSLGKAMRESESEDDKALYKAYIIRIREINAKVNELIGQVEIDGAGFIDPRTSLTRLGEGIKLWRR